MSDHDWTRDYAATYLAGGLKDEEKTRLEAHAAECPACASVIDEARAFEGSLNAIFAPVRPDPTLEDRVIRAIRSGGAPTTLSIWRRAGIGLAAVLCLGALGHLLSTVSEEGPAGLAALPSPMEGLVGGIDGNDESAGRPTGGFREARKAGAFAPRTKEAPEFKDSLGRSRADGATLQWGALGEKSQADSLESADADRSVDRVLAVIPNDSRVEVYQSFRDQAAPELQPSKHEYFRPEAPAVEEALKKVEELARKGKEERRNTPAPDPQRRPAGKKAEAPPVQDPVQTTRKIIRNGELEFEIESFDAAVGTVMKIVSEEGGYVSTVNSEKLENGKVKGEIVLRCPPERLDTLVLKLRGIGDLKGQKITSEDVTKHYTDTESKLRAARQMEARLLEIIKSGKGEIKDLLEAEKQLGEWRQKIELMEGEIRYLNNLVSMCTLRLQLIEKNIRTPASATETEKISMGIEAEEVEKQYQAAIAAIAEAKGRITSSELKRHEGGQYQARITAEVNPDQSASLRDRLKQLGHVARLDVDRDITTAEGSGAPSGTIKKNDSKFDLSIYNLTNIQPRERTQVVLASADAEESFRRLLALAQDEKSGGRVITSNLNRQRGDRTTGHISLEVKAEQAEAMLAAIKAAGEVMKLQTVEETEVRHVTRSKKGYVITIHALGNVAPRETSTVQVASKNVGQAYRAMQEAIQKAKGRVISATLNEQDPRRVTAHIDVEISRDGEAAFNAALKAAGDVVSRNVQRAQDQENVIDSKLRIQLTLLNADAIPPRERWTIGLEVSDVDAVMKAVKGIGCVVEDHFSKDPSGRTVARVVVDVPLAEAGAEADKVKALGIVRAMEASKDASVPDGELAMARLSVTISNADLLIPSDSGFWAQVKKGVQNSFFAIGMSIQLVVIGLCFVLPIGLIAWGLVRAAKRLRPAKA